MYGVCTYNSTFLSFSFCVLVVAKDLSSENKNDE